MDGNKINPKKKKFLTVTAISALTVLVAVTGAVVAFMMKTVESRANNFTFVTADVELHEPEWEKEYPKDPPVVTPGQTVDKNPTVTNTGETPLYVFLKVKIPCAEVQTVKEDKTLGEKKLTNLLSFMPKTDWIKVSPEDGTPVYEKDNDGKEKYSIEVYAYLKELAPKDETGSTSSALFDSVTYADVIEGEPGDRLKFDMPIAVYAIQSENVAEISGTNEEKLKKDYAYGKYYEEKYPDNDKIGEKLTEEDYTVALKDYDFEDIPGDVYDVTKESYGIHNMTIDQKYAEFGAIDSALQKSEYLRNRKF